MMVICVETTKNMQMYSKLMTMIMMMMIMMTMKSYLETGQVVILEGRRLQTQKNLV